MISLGNSRRAAFVLAAELAFFAVQSADAHFLLLWCWFSIKVVMLNIDSRFSECSKTQLTGCHPSLLGCGEDREIFSSLKRTELQNVFLKMLFLFVCFPLFRADFLTTAFILSLSCWVWITRFQTIMCIITIFLASKDLKINLVKTPGKGKAWHSLGFFWVVFFLFLSLSAYDDRLLLPGKQFFSFVKGFPDICEPWGCL